MKKILKRILIIFFAFVNLTCCYCYADSIMPNPIGEIGFITGINIGIIPLLVFLILMVLVTKYFYLKSLESSQEKNESEINEIKIKTNRIGKGIFCCIAILIYVASKFSLIVAEANDKLATEFLIMLVLLIASICCRLKDKKRASYIILAIMIVVSIIGFIYNSVTYRGRSSRYDTMEYEIRQFNFHFQPFCGTGKTADEIYTMMSVVVANNASEARSGSGRFVNITNTGTADTTVLEEAPSIIPKMPNNEVTYKVTAGYGDYGLIVCLDYIEETGNN